MKDWIKRIAVSLVSGSLLGYIVFLWTQNSMIVVSQYADLNVFYYIGLIVALLFLFVVFGVYPMTIKMTKPTLFTLGLLFIVVAHYVLSNDSAIGMYIGDIVKVFGVVLTLLSRSNLLITDKIKKKTEDKHMEVIEV